MGWVEDRRAAAEKRRLDQLERRRLLADGLPAEHLDPRFLAFSVSEPGRACAARRAQNCPLCDVMIQRGDTVRAVARNVFAHWQCIEEYVPRRPRAWNQAAGVLSRLSELRRRVFWAVSCTACGAEPGQGCRTEHGARRRQNHRVRMVTYSTAKRLRRVVADAGVLAELRALRGGGAPWDRKEFLDFRASMLESPEALMAAGDLRWDEVRGVFVDRWRREPVLIQ